MTLSNEQARDYYPLLKWAALRVCPEYGVNEVDDLIQEGYLAMMDCAKKFDSSISASFETFSMHRVKGAMIDRLRKDDPLIRSDSHRKRQLNEARRRVESRKMARATEAEVVEESGLSEDDLRKLGFALEARNARSDIDLSFLPCYSDELDTEKVLRRFYAYVDSLPDRDCDIALLYFRHNINMSSIGAVMDVTGSRVSQIIKNIVRDFIELETHAPSN